MRSRRPHSEFGHLFLAMTDAGRVTLADGDTSDPHPLELPARLHPAPDRRGLLPGQRVPDPRCGRGRILCLDLPQRFLSERRFVRTFLKFLFYTHALARVDARRTKRTKHNLLLRLPNEYQHFVTSSEDGFSDHAVVDVIRGADARASAEFLGKFTKRERSATRVGGGESGCQPPRCVQVTCMATTTISIATDVHDRLCKLRLRPDESFSSVLRRELSDPLETCGELLDHFAAVGVPKANRKLRQALAQGRGRRSRRDT